MEKKWKVGKPELPCSLTEFLGLQAVAENAIEKMEDVLSHRFVDDALCDISGQILEFSGCSFERCIFSANDMKRMSFVDCVFDKCELSNEQFHRATFQRVRFVNCRMTGIGLSDSALMNVSFEGCMMNYLSAATCKLDRVQLINCQLKESLWSSMKLIKASFEDSNLTKAQWMDTPLKGIDVTTCEIAGWSIDLYDLRGLLVTSIQAVQLSGLLGVTVVD